MKAHYRHYKILVNNKPLDFSISIEAYSNKHIDYEQKNCIEKQTKLGRIKEGDKVEFKFLFCTSD